MYYSYTLYQAERTKTPREQREEDIRIGQLAAGLARLLHGPRRGRARRGATPRRDGTYPSRPSRLARAR